MDYQSIVDNLKVSSVIELMEKLGATRWRDEGTHIVFPTICHNIDPDEASMKLYLYKNTKLFNCYTECNVLPYAAHHTNQRAWQPQEGTPF